MYPVFYVGFHCMDCVWEGVWRLKTTLKIKGVFAGNSREDFLRSEPCAQHITGMQRVMTAGFHEYFAGKAFPRDTCETFCFTILTYLIYYVFTHTIYIIITHILRGVSFREKTLDKNPWELEIVIPTILYTILCSFSQLLPLHIQILVRLIAQTLTTHILSVKWGFGVIRKHWKKPFVWWMQSGWIAWFGELEKTRLCQVS